ncbi:MAG: lipocalin-like domain-containing protein [Bacteroidaceae bacterium]|nr:lipocalin-like domain-containing protein [Bacteroidaceae bacterium]MBQ5705103.1 lipocalin-like domain-containing protein [Bacteroidaceae bacterium]MBQ5817308.1 lipocalin-like domain-containing protein [Bacteroidaceae bacterium]
MNSMKMLYALLLFLFLVVSCQKADDNGELGGFWKLLDIEYVASGDKIDCRENSCFMAVQLDLMQLRGNGSHYARFQHRGDSLFIQMIGADADEQLLASMGMDGQEQRFYVRKLTDKSLVLESLYSVLSFRKF